MKGPVLQLKTATVDSLSLLADRKAVSKNVDASDLPAEAVPALLRNGAARDISQLWNFLEKAVCELM